MTDSELRDSLQDRLRPRFAPGWGSQAAVPASWVPYLLSLDDALAALAPAYQLRQVKAKFGGLRYYLDEPIWLPCCVEQDAAYPPAHVAGRESSEEWYAAADAHEASAEHAKVAADREAVTDAMAALISAAEADSYTW